MGTYPPWFDPTYWYDGVTPHPILKRQATVLIRNLAVEFQIVMESAPELVCALAILILLGVVPRRWIEQNWESWFIWVPGADTLRDVRVHPR